MDRLREREDEGFTLAELMVVMVIMMVVGAVFASSMINAMGASRRTGYRADATQALTTASDTVSRQVRAAAPLEQLTATRAVMTVYAGGSKQRHDIEYTASSGTLTDTVCTYATVTSPTCTTGTRTLATRLSMGATPVFVGKMRDGTVTTVASKTASVTFTLVASPAETKPIKIETLLYLRNYQE